MNSLSFKLNIFEQSRSSAECIELSDALSAAPTLLKNIQFETKTVDFYTALLQHITTSMSQPSTTHLDGYCRKT